MKLVKNLALKFSIMKVIVFRFSLVTGNSRILLLTCFANYQWTWNLLWIQINHRIADNVTANACQLCDTTISHPPNSVLWTHTVASAIFQRRIKNNRHSRWDAPFLRGDRDISHSKTFSYRIDRLRSPVQSEKSSEIDMQRF